ncbi:MAG TPA: GAF domain-containing protein [Acidimicrobiales bacterium]
MRPAQKRRGLDELGRLASAGLSVDEFRAASLSTLRRSVTIDAAFYATVDDATMVMTSALSEHPLLDAAARFLDNEYGVADVNKFTDVADLTNGVASLDQVTRGDRRFSPRYRDVMAPIGLGDEVRVVLRSRGRSWGVLCLHREAGEAGFDADEVAFLGRAGTILGEGLRLAVATASVSTGSPTPGGPVFSSWMPTSRSYRPIRRRNDGSKRSTTAAGHLRYTFPSLSWPQLPPLAPLPPIGRQRAHESSAETADG